MTTALTVTLAGGNLHTRKFYMTDMLVQNECSGIPVNTRAIGKVRVELLGDGNNHTCSESWRISPMASETCAACLSDFVACVRVFLDAGGGGLQLQRQILGGQVVHPDLRCVALPKCTNVGQFVPTACLLQRDYDLPLHVFGYLHTQCETDCFR
ncbi:hypothetical protein BC828DRAFT_395210 [Blastocladiella britannica]|nr:hypothetical protein BC828DRAFT_395210 [Blastocladiella britannica]